jgi:hypothetical protein
MLKMLKNIKIFLPKLVSHINKKYIFRMQIIIIINFAKAMDLVGL